jgi:beta-glucosidase
VVQDGDRIAFLRDHLLAVQAAVEEGCNVMGYMAWSLFTDFRRAGGL